jgi:hypothetical protein
MKKITTIILFFIGFSGFSQISYVSTDFALVNESYVVSRATVLNGFDFVATGANSNWNYSALVPNTQETLLWENPNNTGYKLSWCLTNNFLFNCNTQFNNNFNLAIKEAQGIQIQGFGLTNAYMHSNLTTANYANKMIGANITVTGTSLPFTVSYTQPDILYQFPMNFNDTYTNPTSLVFDLNSLGVPLNYNSTGQRVNIVEGWGSLTTPYGTFPNVLKLKSTLTETITIVVNGQTTTNTQTTVSYKWFDKAYGIPVLEVSGPEIAGLWTATNATYFDIQRCLTPNALFGFLPVVSDYDPSTQTASVSFINASTNYDTVNWNFGDGTANSALINPTHVFSCPGTKQVILTVTNQFCDPDQTATITLPVTITDSQNAFTTGVTVSATTLTADRTLTGTTYQWIDCDNSNQPIPNETGQIFTPSVSGNYAVQLNTNGCVSISECYAFNSLGIIEHGDNPKLYLYPNPVKDVLVLSDSTIVVEKIRVYNALGMLVGNSLDLSAKVSGVYCIILETSKGMLIQKIIKQ